MVVRSHVIRFLAGYVVLMAALAALRHLAGSKLDTGTNFLVFLCCVAWLAYGLHRANGPKPMSPDVRHKAWLGVTIGDVIVQSAFTWSLYEAGVPSPGHALLFAWATVVAVNSLVSCLALRHAGRLPSLYRGG